MKRVFSILFVVVLALSMTAGVFAQGGGGKITGAEPLTPDSIVSQPTDGKAAMVRRIAAEDLEVASVIVVYDGDYDVAALEAATGGKVVYQYKKVFNGFSMVLKSDNVQKLADMPKVTAVYLDELLQPDTEVSPGFIGAPAVWNYLGGQHSAGEGVIVGVLDTGIWPEHPSFRDPDSSGKAYAPPPSLPGSGGWGPAGPKNTCDFGDVGWNPNDAPFTCNNKLIGAYDFLDTYKANIGLMAAEFDSARDADGHGTHTTSTAAGNGEVNARIFNIVRGQTSGIAPRAHVIMYKVCGDQGCYSSDSAAAVEQAILDGVDVINFSISGGSNPWGDIVSQAFASAFDNGVFVAASAGNSGPAADTTDHREPWTTTVAASTTDRAFWTTVHLGASNFDTLDVMGVTVTPGVFPKKSVVSAASYGDEMCLNPFAPGTFTGQVVICKRGVIARVEKSYNVMVGGAGGMLLYNPVNQGLATDNHFIPSVHLEFDQGQALMNFFNTHTGVTAWFERGNASPTLGDMMAAFSSRGGPNQSLGVSKPDITAPGVQILAGHTPMPATVVGGKPGELFQSIQGTSMSSPHIAGSAALLKAVHPGWSPAEIKSAMMMTANQNVVKEDGLTPADSFDYGSGRIDLPLAAAPGLTMDESLADYNAYQNDLWNSNYPSVYVPVMPGWMEVTRTLDSQMADWSRWQVYAVSDPDFFVTVPKWLDVAPYGSANLWIDMNAKNVPMGAVRHATVYLKEYRTGDKMLHIPITIVRGEPGISLDKTCAPTLLNKWNPTTDCTITVQNNTFASEYVWVDDTLPPQLMLDPGSVVGGYSMGNYVGWDGTLAGQVPPLVTVNGVTPPAYGFTPLHGVVSPLSPMSDDSIYTFIVSPPIVYHGTSYSQVNLSSNGFVSLGTDTTNGYGGWPDGNLPEPNLPNNVLAPFWSDLDPGAGGDVYAAFLTDGVNTWLVFEWRNIPHWGVADASTFQIWLGVDGFESIFFNYASVSPTPGWSGNTVGAENEYGNTGQMFYYDDGSGGVGTFPTLNWEVHVTGTAFVPGEVHTIDFSANAYRLGWWENCAFMGSYAFDGISTACVNGLVSR